MLDSSILDYEKNVLKIHDLENFIINNEKELKEADLYDNVAQNHDECIKYLGDERMNMFRYKKYIRKVDPYIAGGLAHGVGGLGIGIAVASATAKKNKEAEELARDNIKRNRESSKKEIEAKAHLGNILKRVDCELNKFPNIEERKERYKEEKYQEALTLMDSDDDSELLVAAARFSILEDYKNSDELEHKLIKVLPWVANLVKFVFILSAIVIAIAFSANFFLTRYEHDMVMFRLILVCVLLLISVLLHIPYYKSYRFVYMGIWKKIGKFLDKIIKDK